jgi:hypothetical protein
MLDLAHNHNNNPSNLTSYVNFNNNPPNDNDVYHIHHESNSSPTQSIYSTISSNSLSFLPSSNSHQSSSATSTSSSTSSLSLPANTNFHNNLNHHHFNHHHTQNSNGLNRPILNANLENDDHRRPHTHNHSNHSGSHSHHHSYENFLLNVNGDKPTQLTTAKPTVHSFINFNLTNHHLITSNSKPSSIYKPSSINNNNNYQSYTTTILPSLVLNYNPFKPANHTYLTKNNSTAFNSLNKLNATLSNFQASNSSNYNNLNKPVQSSSWNSFYKPWSNKPTNG